MFCAFPLVVHGLFHWSNASGFQRKPSKRIILLLWSSGIGDLHALLDLLRGFCAAVVRTYARYLGVDVGMRAADTQRESPERPQVPGHPLRWRERAHASCLTQTTHNRHGALRGCAFPPHTSALRRHTRSHIAHYVLDAPWRVVPQQALLCFRSLGFGAGLDDVHMVCAEIPCHHQPSSRCTSSTLATDTFQPRPRCGFEA